MRFICLILSIFFILASFCSAKSIAKNRIISLMPAYTEIIFALGADDKLAGVSNYCDYPEGALKKEKVGDYLRPNFEKIYALKPDVVFTSEWKNSILIKNLINLGLNVEQFKNETEIKDIFETIRIIAAETNKKKEGRELVEKMKKRLEVVLKKTAPNKIKPKVYIEIDRKYWTAGAESFLSDVIKKAGGENIFSGVKRGYFQTSWEVVIEKNPDVIISLWAGDDEYVSRPLSKKIKAVLKNKIISDMDKDKISRPALRVFDIIEDLSVKLQ